MAILPFAGRRGFMQRRGAGMTGPASIHDFVALFDAALPGTDTAVPMKTIGNAISGSGTPDDICHVWLGHARGDPVLRIRIERTDLGFTCRGNRVGTAPR